ncbi:MAG: hypothetical protein ABJG78_00870 [Cyclobacteriaceae bacterium]
MHIQVKEYENTDMDQVHHLIQQLYVELGENREEAIGLSVKFVQQLTQTSSGIVLVMKTFVTNEIVTVATLTESKAIFGGGKYGVLDEIFTRPKFRSRHGNVDLKPEIREIAVKKGWGRIDVAAPTDAWYRTVRFYRNQQFRLTVPKFKYVIDLAGAA